MKKKLTIIFCLLALFCFCLPAFAAENNDDNEIADPNNSKYTVFRMISTSLYFDDDDVAQMTGHASTRDNNRYTITGQINLKRKPIGGSWTSLYTWHGVNQKPYALIMERSKANLAKNYYYKVTFVAKAWDGTTLVETASLDSQTIYFY